MRSLIRSTCVLAGMAALLAALPAGAHHGTADLASPNMSHLANHANPGVTNSDLAFWEGAPVKGAARDLAFAGNYNGFRIFDIADPAAPRLLANVSCRGPQNDVSVYQANNRLLLILSVDRPQTTAACPSSADTPVVSTPEGTLFAPGFEGLRIFDVTNPAAPAHIASVPTACGSHTHTTIPDPPKQRAIIYVSSYPVGASLTPSNADFAGPRCTVPHAKISIVEIEDKAPEAAHVLKEQPLDADTRPFLGPRESGGTGAVGCHDITVLTEGDHGPGGSRGGSDVAAAACLQEGQLWDISDPANPTTTVQGKHTHIYNPLIASSNHPTLQGLFHSASFTWDGEVVLFTDESGGGGTHGCDGAEDTRGNVWFYDNVTPGSSAVVYGRYIIPRPQPSDQACTMHYGNVVPTDDGYFAVSGAYEGGSTVFDFTGVESLTPIPSPSYGQPFVATPPVAGQEIGFFDAQGVDGAGRDDVWSTYWYKDHIWANGGIGRANNPGGRGFDVFELLDPMGDGFHAVELRHMNPQTQERIQSLGG